MGTFSIALTGLKAQSQALNVIGNNLANMSTTAYKDETATFADLFYQQTGRSGSGDALQQGLGVRVQSTDTDFSEGALTTTNNQTDMALNGSGFFVTQATEGSQQLTRAGNFQLDVSGNLITADGASVMGYAAITGKAQSGGALQAIQLPVGQTEAAHASSNFTIAGNLDASAPVGATATSQVKLYDSLGTQYTATMNYTKTAQNQWSYSLALPNGDATGANNNTGTLTFDTSGNLTSPSGGVQNISFTGLSDGAANINMTWQTNDASGNGLLVQTKATSATTATTQDGYPSGAYTGFTVTSDGSVAAQFSNGQTTTIAQLAVANVANVQGLTHAGGNAYTTSLASGQANIGVAGAGGLGTIESQTLEGSNVDISTEFSNLIVAQRAFEANSKTVTTFDTVAQDTIGLIR